MPAVRAKQIRLLQRLCEAIGVSGSEAEVRSIVLEEVSGFADEIRVDALGNVVAIRGSHGGRKPRVMLTAHMDEVGFMIVADDGAGIYQFAPVGGINARYLAGKQVLVGQDHRPAVIGAVPPHLADEELNRDYRQAALRIDLGAEGRAEIGERAAFASTFSISGKAVFARAIDNRIGVATLIEVFRAAPRNIGLCAAFTVQEEIGSMGALAASQSLRPDFAVVIESTSARERPADGVETAAYNSRLGGGPAIYVADKGAVYDFRLVQWLISAARRAHIPFQMRQAATGATDGRAIQGALAGIPTAAIAIPHRYTHAPVSIARLDDWAATMKLLSAALRSGLPGTRTSTKMAHEKGGVSPARRTRRRQVKHAK